MSTPRSLNVVRSMLAIPARGTTYPFLTIFLKHELTELACDLQAHLPWSVLSFFKSTEPGGPRLFEHIKKPTFG